MNPEAAISSPPWLLAALDWIQLHPGEAIVVLALAAGVEGLFLIGMFIPGSLLMFAAGAIAVAGEIPLWPVMLAAGIGAWLGDCASYYLGWRYRHTLPAIAARLRMPGAIERGQKFFARHGGKSIFLGRFIGPLRPLVPAVAGASAMPPLQFATIDLIAALLWAPAYALPGVLVGATLSLAAEITSRLALVMGLGLGLAWLIWWLITHAVRLFQNHAEPWLLRTMDWSHKHRRLGHLGPALADPDQPETPILAISLAALLGATWLIGHLWWQWPGTMVPPAIDEAVYDALAALLSPGLMPLAWHLDAIGSKQLNLLCGLALLLLLAALKHTRMAAHWLAGLLGGALLGLSLPGSGMAIGPSAILGPGTMTTLSLCLWFAFAGLVTTRKPNPVRIGIYLGVGLLTALMLLAKLMLGQISFSQSIIALVISLIWCSLLSLGFRRHLRRPRKLPLTASLALILAILLAGLSISDPRPPTPIQVTWETAALSPARINLLWDDKAPAIDAGLQRTGWQPLAPHSGRDFLAWLRPNLSAAELPPAPQWLAGRVADLRYRRTLDDGTQLILRLWHEQDQRWLGQLGELRVRHWAGLIHVPVTQRTDTAMAQFIIDVGAHWQVRRGPRETLLYRVSPLPR